ncbi:hypothetical protein HYH82_15080 [Clostridium botulinum]|nr:hypothetical protein [Clostridium botulinum]MBY6758614.1 hypothetical protein [Clostridium botulinum]MCR1166692.1 hypothetical protein [Clostridium botulinum]
MYLTNRDRDILKFIEQYGSITINQCSKIFFNKCKQNYYQARKRLRTLYNSKYIKRYRKDMRSEAVYYLDKKLSIHDLKVLDIYAEIINLGAEIKCFKKEYTIKCKNKEYRADGLIECIRDGYFYPILIEVDYTHFTSNKKLLGIYNSNYFQNKYKDLDTDIFPTVLIVRPFLSNNINNLPFNIIYSTMCINNINTLFN